MKSLFTILVLMLGQMGAFGQSPCTPIRLKCEYSLDPLGIDRQDPRLSWQLDDSRQGAAQTAFQIRVSTDSLSLLKGRAETWNSGIVYSSKTNGIVYKGAPLQSRTRYFWQAVLWDKDGKPSRPSTIASFETGIFTYPEWKGAWIRDGQDTAYRAAPYFRKTFTLHGKIRSARAYICGLGYYEMHINGKKVGDHVLDPVYSRFDKTAYYCVYDVSTHLQEGKNALGVLLGNGWYNEQSRAVWFFHKAPWRDRPKLLCNVYVYYEDGHTELIATDPSWKTKASSVIFNNIYSGEYIDHRVDEKGWDQPDYDDDGWGNAIAVVPVPGDLRAQLMPPIRVEKEITLISTKNRMTAFMFLILGRIFQASAV